MKSTLSCWKADGISPRNISQQVIAVRLLKKRNKNYWHQDKKPLLIFSFMSIGRIERK